MPIVANALSYIHPDGEVLFENIHLSIARGEKAALVGNNGAGKSTLLQLLTGRLPPSGGDIVRSSIPYYVPQHLGQYDAYSVAHLLGVDQKLRALQAILEGKASADHFTDLAEDWEVEERIQAALAYWHIQHLDLAQPVHSLSGGEKTKVFLAGTRVHAPDIVLLDEPSNHLDAQSRQLLYEFIRTSKATMLVVSHDRTLLNLLDVMLELSKSGIEVFGGNYDGYQQQKASQLHVMQAQLDENQKTLRQAQQKARAVTEQRHKQEARGKKHSQQQGLPRIVMNALKGQAEQSTAKLRDAQQEKINDLTDNLTHIRRQMQDYQVLKIDLRKSPIHQGKVLVEAKAVNFAYDDQSLWSSPLSFQIRAGDRIRIEGNNGSGKTTLLKLITGGLTPSVGELFTGDFQYWYIDQEYALLDNRLTVFEQMQRFNTRHLLEHELKAMLHYYQFDRQMWEWPCHRLSGGEKMKLTLCCLAASNSTPEVLLLDEPTNNLDVQSQQVFTHAVKGFHGSLLVISHDPYFIQEISIDWTINL